MMKCLAAVASVFLFASAMAVDVPVAYNAGENPSSLADGKVAFTYDNEGRISQLTLNPETGERLVLHGDELNFAGEAVILASGEGESCIANAFSGAEKLTFLNGVAPLGTRTYGAVGDNAYKLPYETDDPDSWRTLFQNVFLHEIEILSSEGPAFYNSNPNLILRPYHVVRQGMTLRCEMQAVDIYSKRHFVKSVWLELRQNGADVEGRIKDYGRFIYTESYEEMLGKSFHENPEVEGYGLRNQSGAYNVRQLSVEIRHRPKVVFELDEDVSLPEMSGESVRIEFKAKPPADDTLINYGEANNKDYKLPYAADGYKTVFPNTDLCEIEPVSSDGSVQHSAVTPLILHPYHVVRDGATMRVEFQGVDSYKNKPFVKCLWIWFRQNGSDVEATIKNAGFIYTNNTSEVLGKSFYENPEVKDYTERESGDYNTSQFTMRKIATALTVTADKANTMVNAAFILRADGSNKLTFRHNNTYAFPQGTVDAYGNATITHEGQIGRYNNGSTIITIHSGSVIEVRQNECIAGGYETTPLVLDGGLFRRLSGRAHPQCLILKNGARIEDVNDGYYFMRVLYYNTGARWLVTGDGASTVNLVGEYRAFDLYYNNGLHELPIHVEDTVQGDGIDFIWNGDIKSSAANGLDHDVCIAKHGVGTMQLNGQIRYTYRPTRVAEGTLLLGQSDAVAEEASFLMDGGTLALAEDTENACKGITVSGDAAIDFGKGATLSLSSLTVSDGAVLTLTGDALGKLKVENPIEEDAGILFNGRRVRRDANGYLTSFGLVLSIR